MNTLPVEWKPSILVEQASKNRGGEGSLQFVDGSETGGEYQKIDHQRLSLSVDHNALSAETEAPRFLKRDASFLDPLEEASR